MFIYVLLFYRGSSIFDAYRASIYLEKRGKRNKYRALNITLGRYDKEKLSLYR